jgi:hypothetical protein
MDNTRSPPRWQRLVTAMMTYIAKRKAQILAFAGTRAITENASIILYGRYFHQPSGKQPPVLAF